MKCPHIDIGQSAFIHIETALKENIQYQKIDQIGMKKNLEFWDHKVLRIFFLQPTFFFFKRVTSQHLWKIDFAHSSMYISICIHPNTHEIRQN